MGVFSVNQKMVERLRMCPNLRHLGDGWLKVPEEIVGNGQGEIRWGCLVWFHVVGEVSGRRLL